MYSSYQKLQLKTMNWLVRNISMLKFCERGLTFIRSHIFERFMIFAYQILIKSTFFIPILDIGSIASLIVLIESLSTT